VASAIGLFLQVDVVGMRFFEGGRRRGRFPAGGFRGVVVAKMRFLADRTSLRDGIAGGRRRRQKSRERRIEKVAKSRNASAKIDFSWNSYYKSGLVVAGSSMNFRNC